MSRAHDWIEIALDYRCNLRCLGCRACEDNGERLATADALEVMRDARRDDVPNLWIGGGEPTLHPELLALVARARALGFERVLLQTNGLRLSYPRFADALLAAGVTDVSFNVKSHRAEVTDALTRSPGSHELLLAGIANVAGRLRVAADVLITRSTAPDLAETVRVFAERGVERFSLWLLSAADSTDPAVAAEVPRLSDVSGFLAAASAVAREQAVELVSLHTPPCTLPSEHRARYLPARALRLLVVDPSRRAFPLESSPFEGGSYPDGCARCGARAGCGGARSDYLALHGSAELIPI